MEKKWDDTLWEFEEEMDPRSDAEMREWYSGPSTPAPPTWHTHPSGWWEWKEGRWVACAPPDLPPY